MLLENLLDKNGITLLIHGMSGGGAEHCAANMANHWAQSGRSVSVITFAIRENENYPLLPSVKRIALDDINLENGWQETLWGKEEGNIKQLSKALRIAGNRAVLSFMTKMNIRAILADNKDEYDIFITEHTHPPHDYMPSLICSFRDFLYPRAKNLVVLTNMTKEEWADQIPGISDVKVIPNFISQSTASKQNNGVNIKQNFFLACGRLIELKQFDRLIESYSNLYKKHGNDFPDLKIAGQGPLFSFLEDLCVKLGVTQKVQLLGWRKDINVLMAQAKALILSSQYEGFPCVLLETMAAGTLPISFDCPTGPSDIISDNMDGLLVKHNDWDELELAMETVAKNDELRKRLSANAQQKAEEYEAEKIMRIWDQLIWQNN